MTYSQETPDGRQSRGRGIGGVVGVNDKESDEYRTDKGDVSYENMTKRRSIRISRIHWVMSKEDT